MHRKLTRPCAGNFIPEIIIMFHHLRFHGAECLCSDASFAMLLVFVEEYRGALQHAAELLAGGRGAALAARIAEDLSVASTLSRRSRCDLEDLLGILALENVDDPDREEAARFAAIDPASPVVKEVCLLSDGLRDLLTMADTDHRPASRTWIAA